MDSTTLTVLVVAFIGIVVVVWDHLAKDSQEKLPKLN